MSQTQQPPQQRRRISSILKVIGQGVTIILALYGLYEIGKNIWGYFDESNQQERANRRVRVLVPLLATQEEFLKFMHMEEKRGLKYSSQYKFSKKVSRDVMNSVTSAAQSWFAVHRTQQVGLSDDKVDFYFFPEGHDEVSYKRALTKAIKESLFDGFEIASLIGNVTSTATVEYGKLVGGLKEGICKEIQVLNETCGPFPMILPMATAANVTQTLRSNGVDAVLRLPPDNKQQAKLIAESLLRRSNKPIQKCVIVRDLSNKQYSNDLYENFQAAYVKEPLDASQKTNNSTENGKQVSWGTILTSIPSGGEQGNEPIFATIEKQTPEAVLVFGMTEVSLDTISQLRVSKFKPTVAILTDGAVDEYLQPQIRPIIDPRSKTELYLSFPLDEPNPSSVEEITKTLPLEDKRNLEMTHAMYVIDSVYIVLTLLDEGIFKQKRLEVTSKMMTDQINALYKDGSKNIGIAVPSKVAYAFDVFGNSTGLDYHLYRVCFSDLPGCPKNKDYSWVKTDILSTNK